MTVSGVATPELLPEVKTVRILYVNHEGKISFRLIEPVSLFFGSTPYHPEPQWLMMARDLDKGGVPRNFAMKDISMWEVCDDA